MCLDIKCVAFTRILSKSARMNLIYVRKDYREAIEMQNRYTCNYLKSKYTIFRVFHLRVLK